MPGWHLSGATQTVVPFVELRLAGPLLRFTFLIATSVLPPIPKRCSSDMLGYKSRLRAKIERHWLLHELEYEEMRAFPGLKAQLVMHTKGLARRLTLPYTGHDHDR